MMFIIKIIANIFYEFEVNWLSPEYENPCKALKDVKLLILLNHTSLYEPVYIGVLPIRFLWRFTRKVIFPIASKTLDRPLVGSFWKILASKKASLTRKRDDSWHNFLNMIDDNCHVVFAPEGRMKRVTGLDLHGNKMTIRGGTSEILNKMNSGKILIMYSGGLHHLQSPGQIFPKPFKKLKLNLQLLDIQQYKTNIESKSGDFKNEVVKDLQYRLENYCPSMDKEDCL